ncbi:50S ribosomal protein L4 [Candidatus Jorgensenbacteria bacterium GWA1_54_12]|uniref:Large ribosomal subunit protein uL4 n=1 Tax=Candidatus Jorgensenbacteria bacterium GWA1_54_12 TaxID=1798468 RepID=A0A1F6BL62_9BACT|nr:MAG: 50S ribosomal protein L4 [Candidatus Jorgensenbacteria bacterium GWA1_54_12]
MKVPIYTTEEKTEGEIEISRELFDTPWKPILVHRAAVVEEANRRVKLTHPKDRGDVRGGGRKPWRQKGTGRARHGSIRSPLWRGGGVTFGSAPRVYEKKINRKERRLALRSLLSKKYADGDLRVVTPLAAERVSSKELRERLHTFLHGKTLIVASGGNRSLYLSARNLSRVGVVRADTLQVGDLLRHRRVLVEAGALNEIPA